MVAIHLQGRSIRMAATENIYPPIPVATVPKEVVFGPDEENEDESS